MSPNSAALTVQFLDADDASGDLQGARYPLKRKPDQRDLKYTAAVAASTTNTGQ